MTEATKGQRWRRTQSTEEPPRFRPVQNPEPRLPPLEGRKASPQMEPPPVPQSNPWPLDHLPDDASRAPSIVAKARPSFRQTSTAQHEDRSHEFAPTLHAPEPEEYQDDVERYEPAKRSSGRGILYACIGFLPELPSGTRSVSGNLSKRPSSPAPGNRRRSRSIPPQPGLQPNATNLTKSASPKTRRHPAPTPRV